MERPGQRINQRALEAMNVVLAERQTALNALRQDIAELEMSAAKAKVEVRFIHYCQQRDPTLVHGAAEKLKSLEMELEGLGTSLNYRLEQEDHAVRQMEAFREFLGAFQEELSRQLSTEPAEKGRQAAAEAEAA